MEWNCQSYNLSNYLYDIHKYRIYVSFKPKLDSLTLYINILYSNYIFLLKYSIHYFNTKFVSNFYLIKLFLLLCILSHVTESFLYELGNLYYVLASIMFVQTLFYFSTYSTGLNSNLQFLTLFFTLLNKMHYFIYFFINFQEFLHYYIFSHQFINIFYNLFISNRILMFFTYLYILYILGLFLVCLPLFTNYCLNYYLNLTITFAYSINQNVQLWLFMPFKFCIREYYTPPNVISHPLYIYITFILYRR